MTIKERFYKNDPFLQLYRDAIESRITNIIEKEVLLTKGNKTLADFASGHNYFGLHFSNNQWTFREWAPNANSVFLIGEITGWQELDKYSLNRISDSGVWEIVLAEEDLKHKDLYRLRIHWPGGEGDRVPSYANRVVQDPHTLIFNAQVWFPLLPYKWRFSGFKCFKDAPFIYEAHIGMAQEEEKIGTYREFADKILPRIINSGYNIIQLMAIQEHPYYGSFGYQVSNFFAASSRFGTPEDLKELIDSAHSAGIAVVMDIIHSHAVSNEVEGLSRFDGTMHQYFHDGPRGMHNAWDSRCFDYNKIEVLNFLLSNCKYWLEEYHFDGFRFDGITSMLYLHHGLEEKFSSYDGYFSRDVDEDALTYLALANKLIHDIRPDAITIAEDISGMPGLAVPISEGGFGFDYRFAMGIPDFWIRLVKDSYDEDWPTGHLWYELNNKRIEEKTISYCESHDQALVGDQSLIFRLIGVAIFDHMTKGDNDFRVDRGIALHKLIRLITLSTAGNGYLNFMGNEFGHPEWIDFPRQGNNWSYHYARRQWHLVDDSLLKYHLLANFDRDMIAVAKQYNLLESSAPLLLYENTYDKIIAFRRAGLLFVFNFHPTCSFTNYCFDAPPGTYHMIFESDALIYGGHGRLIPGHEHKTICGEAKNSKRQFISLYLPTRTGIVLKYSE
ncbi:MAG: alpha amylase C-terminal domain-containing protein [Proteobacteria bacterium]|nr:alpha amylase C-terminal domain-containing protein [Pseudomonadota bacterium]MBU4009553.1 alpha amylase C-terminal domain-containing protein [Pseudomonadota bacterium]